jgi:hypothetical protein
MVDSKVVSGWVDKWKGVAAVAICDEALRRAVCRAREHYLRTSDDAEQDTDHDEACDHRYDHLAVAPVFTDFTVFLANNKVARIDA